MKNKIGRFFENQYYRILVEIIVGILLSLLINFLLITLGYSHAYAHHDSVYSVNSFFIPIYKITAVNGTMDGIPYNTNMFISGFIFALIFSLICEVIYILVHKSPKKRGV